VSDLELPLAELEVLIFSASEPLSAAAIRRALSAMTPARIDEAVAQINARLAETGRPYEIAAIAGGYQFRTRPEFGDFLAAAQPERRVRLSKAALETLAVVAYRQPITRPEIEEVRSVDCGPVLRSLMERDLVRIVGRRDAPGKPPLYGTTAVFLETFGLRSLRDMPTLREIASSEEQMGTPNPEAGAADELASREQHGALAPETDAEDPDSGARIEEDAGAAEDPPIRAAS
jgi:segregation and condensation protein B